MKDGEKPSIKRRLAHELFEFWLVAAYLLAILASFSMYRSLLVSDSGPLVYQYGANLVEALVLGKVVLVGEYMKVGARFQERSLLLPTLYKTLCFMVLIVVFTVCEHLVLGLFHHRTAGEVVDELVEHRSHEILGRALVLFVAFVPFFAVREMERVLGKGVLGRLFFRRRPGEGMVLEVPASDNAG